MRLTLSVGQAQLSSFWAFSNAFFSLSCVSPSWFWTPAINLEKCRGGWSCNRICRRKPHAHAFDWVQT